MTLHYLIFDRTDDTLGWVSFEAMASVPHYMLPEVMAEVETVLAWLDAQAPGPRGPLEDGGAWDADLLTQADGADRVCVTLTVAAGDGLADAWAGHFSVD